MAMCQWCELEMRVATTCTVDALHVQGRRIEMIRFGAERRPVRGRICSDCGVSRGGHHHPGCDLQVCPRCSRQMMSCDCEFDEDEFDEDEFDQDAFDAACEPFGVDGNGVPIERMMWGDMEVIVGRADYPASDITTFDGIRCTTALRTMIDIAVEVSREDLHLMFLDCLDRDLFTLDQARRRVGEPDMATHKGASLVRHLFPPGI